MTQDAPRRQSGFTLIEAVLVLALGLSVLVGGIIFFSQAQDTSRFRDMGLLLTTITTRMSQVTRLEGYVVVNNNKAIMLDMVPPSFVDGSKIRTPVGGDLYLGSESPWSSFFITMRGVPPSYCKRVASRDTTIAGGSMKPLGFRINGVSTDPDDPEPGLCRLNENDIRIEYR